MRLFRTLGLGAALAAALALPGIAQEAPPAAAQDGQPPGAETVVATVNGTAITLGHMAMLRSQLPAQYLQLPDAVLFNAILDQLIQQTALAQLREGNLSRSDELALENSRRAYLASAALMAHVEAAVTEEAIAAAYAERYASAEPALEYNAAHILVPTLEEAQKLKAELDAGADFAELARTHSKDGAAQRGGDLGWFGKGMMVAPFEEAVMAMEPGSYSDPVQTQFGWHLIHLKETRLAETPTLEEVRGELTEALQQEAVQAFIAERTAAATVTRSVEGIDPAVLRDENLVSD